MRLLQKTTLAAAVSLAAAAGLTLPAGAEVTYGRRHHVYHRHRHFADGRRGVGRHYGAPAFAPPPPVGSGLLGGFSLPGLPGGGGVLGTGLSDGRGLLGIGFFGL